MIIKNLLPAYNNRLLSSPINSFAELHDCGMRIEDAINTRQVDISEAKLQAKKVFNEGEKGGVDFQQCECCFHSTTKEGV